MAMATSGPPEDDRLSVSRDKRFMAKDVLLASVQVIDEYLDDPVLIDDINDFFFLESAMEKHPGDESKAKVRYMDQELAGVVKKASELASVPLRRRGASGPDVFDVLCENPEYLTPFIENAYRLRREIGEWAERRFSRRSEYEAMLDGAEK